ncbi:MAG: hypothetical protein JST87_04430 [Bacteroidetes bacterium]|nr:hypothetical protein [Bacteroidota bacterium]
MLKKRSFFLTGSVLLILLTVLLFRGLYLYNKPHKSAEAENAVATISANDLYQQYITDEKKADQTYLGKVIEVTGVLSAITHSGANEIWIISASAQGGINCQMFPGKQNEFSEPKAGDKINIKGKCTGFLMDVNLTDCVVQK